MPLSDEKTVQFEEITRDGYCMRAAVISKWGGSWTHSSSRRLVKTQSTPGHLHFPQFIENDISVGQPVLDAVRGGVDRWRLRRRVSVTRLRWLLLLVTTADVVHAVNRVRHDSHVVLVDLAIVVVVVIDVMMVVRRFVTHGRHQHTRWTFQRRSAQPHPIVGVHRRLIRRRFGSADRSAVTAVLCPVHVNHERFRCKTRFTHKKKPSRVWW